MQDKVRISITVMVLHKFSPDTKEIQSSKFSVSYFKLTIVLIIPKIKIGINAIETIKIIL